MKDISDTDNSTNKNSQNEPISYLTCITPLGLIIMATTDRGVCFVQFGESEEKLKQQLQKEFAKATLSPSNANNHPQLKNWIDALNGHLSLGKPKPDLPLDMRGTAFQVMVWQFLVSVREGETLSYTELAKRIGKPKAIRAVASACARNRIGILIPCHRVLRSDGNLGGYRWGLDRKQSLIDKEKDT